MDWVSGPYSVEVIISNEIHIFAQVSSHDSLSIFNNPRRILRALRSNLIDQGLAVAWLFEVVRIFQLHGRKQWFNINSVDLL